MSNAPAGRHGAAGPAGGSSIASLMAEASSHAAHGSSTPHSQHHAANMHRKPTPSAAEAENTKRSALHVASLASYGKFIPSPPVVSTGNPIFHVIPANLLGEIDSAN